MFYVKHTEAVTKSSEFLTSLGWEGNYDTTDRNIYRPDLQFEDDLDRMLLVEVKPFYIGKQEFCRGIKQTLYPPTINFDVLSAYIINYNELFVNATIDVFNLSDFKNRLFLITYDSNYNFTQRYGESLKTISIDIHDEEESIKRKYKKQRESIIKYESQEDLIKRCTLHEQKKQEKHKLIEANKIKREKEVKAKEIRELNKEIEKMNMIVRKYPRCTICNQTLVIIDLKDSHFIVGCPNCSGKRKLVIKNI